MIESAISGAPGWPTGSADALAAGLEDAEDGLL